jgi:hypothetical protein
MRGAIPLLVTLAVSVASTARADDTHSARALRLTTAQLLQSVESLPSPGEHEAEKFVDRIVDYVQREKLGIRGLFTLLPAESPVLGEIKPPRFAFVARAMGRTIVSLTQPGSPNDREDHVLLQRWLVSDLLKGRRYSLTVYKEDSVDKDALRFLGVGARLLLRPDFRIANWQFRIEVFGSYHPDHAATAYIALSGRAFAPPLPITGIEGSAVVQPQQPVIPLRW